VVQVTVTDLAIAEYGRSAQVPPVVPALRSVRTAWIAVCTAPSAAYSISRRSLITEMVWRLVVATTAPRRSRPEDHDHREREHERRPLAVVAVAMGWTGGAGRRTAPARHERDADVRAHDETEPERVYGRASATGRRGRQVRAWVTSSARAHRRVAARDPGVDGRSTAPWLITQVTPGVEVTAGTLRQIRRSIFLLVASDAP
jgi:hypothetical protein